MGHCRMFKSFSLKYDRKRIAADIQYEVTHSGDRYGTDHIEFLDGVCATYDDAVAALEKHGKNDWYPGYAIKYELRSNTKTKKVQDAESSLSKLNADRKTFAEKHSIHQRKSAFIGCPHCESKLANDRFKGEFCPVCRGDLRPQTTIDKLKDYDAKIKKAQDAVNAAWNENAVIGTEWLVMYEYHC